MRKTRSAMRKSAVRHESDFTEVAGGAETLGVGAFQGGQRKPYSCPEDCPQGKSALGEPIDIEDVAMLLGCSVWTVRQRYLRGGLPHLRASARGRFVFFREQVIDWILERQRKGGR
jgi:hypothetical protein